MEPSPRHRWNVDADSMSGPRGTISPSSETGDGRVHGVRLVDPGSCEITGTGTITLDEWHTQQKAGIPG